MPVIGGATRRRNEYCAQACSRPAQREQPIAAHFATKTRLAIVLGALALGFWAIWSVSSCRSGALVSRMNALRGDAYPLDEIERSVDEDAGVACPELELVTFEGEKVRFLPSVRVVAPFAERLRRFETVLVEVAERHYGRSPRSVVNAGAYLCRPVRHRSYRLSEHALGNAVDVVGFDFGPSKKRADAGASDESSSDAGTFTLPSSLTGPFRVRVERHWRAESDEAAVRHARFLDDLTRELAERSVFRTILGPSHPTHRTHFHFDMGPWSHVMP